MATAEDVVLKSKAASGEEYEGAVKEAGKIMCGLVVVVPLLVQDSSMASSRFCSSRAANLSANKASPVGGCGGCAGAP